MQEEETILRERLESESERAAHASRVASELQVPRFRRLQTSANRLCLCFVDKRGMFVC